jgi:hypothetical protein
MVNLIILTDDERVHCYHRYKTACGLAVGDCENHACHPYQETDDAVDCDDCKSK